MWVFKFESDELARRAKKVAMESSNEPRLGLLALTGACLESSSPERTSGSVSGTN